MTILAQIYSLQKVFSISDNYSIKAFFLVMPIRINSFPARLQKRIPAYSMSHVLRNKQNCPGVTSLIEQRLKNKAIVLVQGNRWCDNLTANSGTRLHELVIQHSPDTFMHFSINLRYIGC